MIDEKFRQERDDACDRWIANFCKKELQMDEDRNDAPLTPAEQQQVDRVMASSRQGPALEHAAPNIMATPNSSFVGSFPTVTGAGGISNATIAGLTTPSGGPSPAASDPSISSVELQGAGSGGQQVADKAAEFREDGDVTPHAAGSATDPEHEDTIVNGPLNEDEVDHSEEEDEHHGE